MKPSSQYLLAAVIGGLSQSISQNMGPTLAAVLISNLVNMIALSLAYEAGRKAK